MLDELATNIPTLSLSQTKSINNSHRFHVTLDKPITSVFVCSFVRTFRHLQHLDCGIGYSRILFLLNVISSSSNLVHSYYRQNLLCSFIYVRRNLPTLFHYVQLSLDKQRAQITSLLASINTEIGWRERKNIIFTWNLKPTLTHNESILLLGKLKNIYLAFTFRRVTISTAK